MQDVDVVSVNYHSDDHVATLVAELAAVPTSELRVRVTVVDCSGMGGSAVQAIQAAGVPTEIVDAGGNVGFARAANLGAKRGAAGVVVFANPDLALHVAGFTRLVREGATSGSAAWSGVLRNNDRDRSLQLNAAPEFSIGRLLLEYVAGRDTRLPPTTVAREVAVLTGALLVVNRDSFEAVGGFDESFPLYVEDVDLCDRLRSTGVLRQFPIEVGVHTGGGSARHAPLETWLLLHASRVAYFRRRGRVAGGVARAAVLLGLLIRSLLVDRRTWSWLPPAVRATAADFDLVSLLPEPVASGGVAPRP